MTPTYQINIKLGYLVSSLLSRLEKMIYFIHNSQLPTMQEFRAEILLRSIQPGRKKQISMSKFTEVRKHSRCACSRSFFRLGMKK